MPNLNTSTENEASERWCPFARIVREEGSTFDNPKGVLIGGVNRDALGTRAEGSYVFPHSCRCIGSKCMAWRWSGIGLADFASFRGQPSMVFIRVPWTHAPDKESIDAIQKLTVEPERPTSVPPSFIWVPYDPDKEEWMAGWREPDAEFEARRLGYCGLARTEHT